MNQRDPRELLFLFVALAAMYGVLLMVALLGELQLPGVR